MSNQIDIVLNAVDEASKTVDGVNKSLGGTDKAAKGAGMSFGNLSSIVGEVAPWATLGSAVLSVGAYLGQASKAAAMNAEVMAKQEAIIKATGGSAGYTSAQLVRMADELERLTHVDGDLIIANQSLLHTFRNIGGEEFPRAMKAAIDLQTTFGSLEASTMQLGKALNDPVAGISALARSGVTFSEVQKQQIKDFVAVNDLASAQAVILSEVESQVGGTAAAIAAAGDGSANLTNATGALSEAIGRQVLPHLRWWNKELADLAWRLAEITDNSTEAKTAAETLMERQNIPEWMRGISNNALYFAIWKDEIEAVNDELDQHERAARKAADMTAYYSEKTTVAAEVTEEMAQAASKANQDFLKLTENLAGDFGKAQEQAADFAKKRGEIEAEISEKLKLGYWEQGEVIQDLRGKLGELAEAEQAAAGEAELAGRRRILSMLEQKLTVDGLSDAEMNYLLELGNQWGIYSSEAVTAAQQAIREVDLLKAKFDNLPEYKRMTIAINEAVSRGYDYQMLAAPSGPGFANGTGGQWLTVPPGHPNDSYPVRLQSGEEFAVRSRAEVAQGGGGMSIDYDRMADAFAQAMARAGLVQ